MKRLVILLLTLYQLILSPLLVLILGRRQICRYDLSCSEYAKQMIQKNGIIRGSKHAMRRFLSCRPGALPYGNTF